MTDNTPAPAAEPASPATPAPAAAPAPSTPELTPHQQFLEMLPEDLRADPSFSPYKGENINEIVGKLAKSYVNVNKLVGADKAAILKIPDLDDKEGWDQVYSKLGRPEKPEEYGADKYKEFFGFDENNFNEITKVAHENGVSAKAFEAIVSKYFEQMGSAKQLTDQETEQALEKYTQDLQNEWGKAYEAKTNKVLATLQKYADPEFLTLAKDYPFIFDHPSVMKTLDNIIKASSEDGAPKSGDSSSNAPMTPDEAKAALAAFESDKEKMKILMTGGHPHRDVVLAERQRLFNFAFGAKS